MFHVHGQKKVLLRCHSSQVGWGFTCPQKTWLCRAEITAAYFGTPPAGGRVPHMRGWGRPWGLNSKGFLRVGVNVFSRCGVLTSLPSLPLSRKKNFALLFVLCPCSALPFVLCSLCLCSLLCSRSPHLLSALPSSALCLCPFALRSIRFSCLFS